MSRWGPELRNGPWRCTPRKRTRGSGGVVRGRGCREEHHKSYRSARVLRLCHLVIQIFMQLRTEMCWFRQRGAGRELWGPAFINGVLQSVSEPEMLSGSGLRWPHPERNGHSGSRELAISVVPRRLELAIAWLCTEFWRIASPTHNSKANLRIGIRTG